MMAFMTPFGLLCITILHQEYTNGMQVFDRVIRRVLKDPIAENHGKSFINNVAVKLISRSLYVSEETEKLLEVIPSLR